MKWTDNTDPGEQFGPGDFLPDNSPKLKYFFAHGEPERNFSVTFGNCLKNLPELYLIYQLFDSADLT